MVAAYHLIWTVYGYWLPNDLRGSTSRELRCANFAPLGEIHYGRKKVQPSSREIREFFEAAKGLLKHELLTFSEPQYLIVAENIGKVIRDNSLTCYGCAIMPDHIHLLIRKHRLQAEEMIEKFQDESREAICCSSQFRHGLDHPVWGGPGWKVFLDTQEDIRRVIRYIEQNPVKIGRPVQRWPFVQVYDGWLPGRVRYAKPRNRKRGNNP